MSRAKTTCLGLKGSANVELDSILEQIAAKLSKSTLLTPTGVAAFPIPETLASAADEEDGGRDAVE